MRTVRIDFTNQSVSYPDGTLAGRRGEHLMTQLIISLPEEMGASEIEYYRLAFCRYGNEERFNQSDHRSHGGRPRIPLRQPDLLQALARFNGCARPLFQCGGLP